MVYRRCDFYKEKQPEAKVGEIATIYYSHPPDDFDMKIVEYKGVR